MSSSAVDYELEALLALDGYVYQFAAGYRIKIEAKRSVPTHQRPWGVKYSLTLHDPKGRRIFGIDNAHGIRRQTAFDHRHIHLPRKIVPYEFRSPAQLLEDFYREVERILGERDVR